MVKHEVRVVHALVLREIILKFRQSRVGYLLTLGEPIAQYSMMLAVFTAINRKPDYGTSLALFLATGIVPYFFFMHLSTRVAGASRAYAAFRKLIVIMPLDVALARAVFEGLTLILFGTLVFFTLAFVGVAGARPADPAQLILCVLSLLAIAFGTGLVNSVLAHMFKLWGLIYSIISRSMLFFSGVFYVPATLPPVARDYLWWNPLQHGIEWFRLCFYPSYPAAELSIQYMLIWAVASITLGIAMDRYFTPRWK